MKLAVVNGSPRGRKSNSDRIMGWMAEPAQIEFKVYTSEIKKHQEAAKKVAEADSILFVFPLYTDMMPGSFKAFLEKLNEYELAGKSAAFIVHSGFAEAVHSRAVEKYCRWFAKSKGMKLLGCAVMGGSEALQAAPDEYFGKRRNAYDILKKNLAEQRELDADAIKTIARIEKFSKAVVFLFKFFPTDMYWNKMLKKNGAYEKRHDKPYAAK